MEFLFGGFEADMMCSLLIEIMPSFVHGVVIDKFITGIFQPAASSVNSVLLGLSLHNFHSLLMFCEH